MYADYQYYVDEYGGNIPQESYTALERKAEAFIRYLTYLNGDIFATVDTAVQNAVCAAVDCLSQRVEIQSGSVVFGGQAVKSESNDGYSVTYADGESIGTADENLRKAVLEAVRMYLLPTGWLSRIARCGCVHDCDCDHL